MVQAHRNRTRLAAMGLAFMGALVAAAGALLFYNQQAQMTASSMWPLPGLVLTGWAVLGLVVLLAAIISQETWLRAGWTAVGALAALGVLSMFSIGLLVLASLLFCLPAMVLASLSAVQAGRNWYHALGFMMLGVIGLVFALLAARIAAS